MGTNFYWKVDRDDRLPTGEPVPYDSEHPSIHLGKRSAAGLYCWDDDVTLCTAGNEGIHMGLAFHATCPVCGKGPEPFVAFREGPAAVELGFAKPNTARPTGVRGASSFTWAQDPAPALRACRSRRGRPKALIVDEYGRDMTGPEFLEMLESNCPIQFTTSIGSWFS
jgi:hypothetical protein